MVAVGGVRWSRWWSEEVQIEQRLLWSDPAALTVWRLQLDLTSCLFFIYLFILSVLFSAQRRRNEWNRLQGGKEPPTPSRTHRPARPAWGKKVSGVTQHHVCSAPTLCLSEAPGRSTLMSVTMLDSCWHLELIIHNDPGREATLTAEDLDPLVPAGSAVRADHGLTRPGWLWILSENNEAFPHFSASYVLSYLSSVSCLFQCTCKAFLAYWKTQMFGCIVFASMPPTHTHTFVPPPPPPYIFLTPQ